MGYIKIGKIVNTHGIKGEFRIKSDVLHKDKIFKVGNNLYIGEGHIKEEITSYRVHKDYDMVTFKGYPNINEVLIYKNFNVYILEEELNLNNDEVILETLIGFKIIDDNNELGTLQSIHYNGLNILLDINYTKPYYIPYNPNFIDHIDKENKIIYTKNAKDLII